MVASHHPPTRSSPPCSTPILVLAGLGCWYAGTQPFPMNLVNGLRVTTAAEAILAAARDLGVLDLVILGDSALRLLRIDGTVRRREASGD